MVTAGLIDDLRMCAADHNVVAPFMRAVCGHAAAELAASTTREATMRGALEYIAEDYTERLGTLRALELIAEYRARAKAALKSPAA